PVALPVAPNRPSGLNAPTATSGVGTGERLIFQTADLCSGFGPVLARPDGMGTGTGASSSPKFGTSAGGAGAALADDGAKRALGAGAGTPSTDGAQIATELPGSLRLVRRRSFSGLRAMSSISCARTSAMILRTSAPVSLTSATISR